MSFPSIYEAERGHKDKTEDRATCRLFAHLGRLSPNIRSRFLALIGFLGPTDSTELRGIDLWYSLQAGPTKKREIDAILRFADRIVGVENKFHADLDPAQLVDEFGACLRKFGKAELATITSHPVAPKEVAQVSQQLGVEIKWTSWTKCLLAAKTLAGEPDTDSASKQSLRDLIDYLEALEVKVRPGFNREEDWRSFHRLMFNTETLVETVTKIIKSAGLAMSTESWPHWDYSELAFWGRWIYSETKSSGETGVWFGIGLIDGLDQAEFAAYEGEGRNNLTHLLEKGYRLTEKFWSKGYSYYSKYLPMAHLKSDTYEGQEEELTEFVRQSLADIGLEITPTR